MEKQDWLKNNLNIVRNNMQVNDDILSYRKFLLYAQRYNPVRANVKVIMIEDFDFLIPERCEPEKILNYVKNWYKKTAKHILGLRIEHLRKTLKIAPKQVKISDSHGRWGSCNSKGVICLNWRIIMLSPRLIDYVLVHELVHLIELNHSVEFWKIISLIMPDYMALRKEIKQESYLLDLFKNIK